MLRPKVSVSTATLPSNAMPAGRSPLCRWMEGFAIALPSQPFLPRRALVARQILMMRAQWAARRRVGGLHLQHKRKPDKISGGPDVAPLRHVPAARAMVWPPVRCGVENRTKRWTGLWWANPLSAETHYLPRLVRRCGGQRSRSGRRSEDARLDCMARTDELSRPAGQPGGRTGGAEATEPFLEQLRRAELRLVADILQRHGCAPGCSILEIGGGTGWQARDLERAGYKVRSVDVEAKPGVFPVELYDGHRLPCEDASCDVIFSSNVLEHVAHIDAFQAEMRRVLKPGGIAVHLMPTPVVAAGDVARALPLARPHRFVGPGRQGRGSRRRRSPTGSGAARGVVALAARHVLAAARRIGNGARRAVAILAVLLERALSPARMARSGGSLQRAVLHRLHSVRQRARVRCETAACPRARGIMPRLCAE